VQKRQVIQPQETSPMGKLTDKQKQFLQKHNFWDAAKNKSTLSVFEESNFKDFDRRKEKTLAELQRLPDAKRNALEKKLNEADAKAKNKQFKEAYHDLKQVKKDARREANGYVDSLSLQDVAKQLAFLSTEANNLNKVLDQLQTGQQTVLDQLDKQQKASSFNTIGEAAAFLRDFRPTETLLRAQVAGLKSTCGQIANYLEQAKVDQQLKDIQHQVSVLLKEHQADVTELTSKHSWVYAKFMHKGELLTASDVKADFDQFARDFDNRVKVLKDVSKFQKREAGGESISGETVMRDAGAQVHKPSELDKLLQEIAKGSPKDEFDVVVFELQDVENALSKQQTGNPTECQKELEARKEKALLALGLLVERDAWGFADSKLSFLLDSMGDKLTLAKTTQPVAQTQPLQSFNPATLNLSLPGDLKKIKDDKIREVRDEVETQMKTLLNLELKKADSDIVFDLGLKTKADFLTVLADDLQIDLKSPKCSKNEKKLLDQMAEQMAATVRQKFPNKAGKPVKVKDKAGDEVEVPSEINLRGVKYSEPKYLAHGGFGHVLRYKDPSGQQVVLKTLKDPKNRDEMARELKMHRQAMGGEQGPGHPNVVGLKGAIQGPSGELYMAVEYAEGGDLEGLSYGLAGAAESGALSEEARQILVQHFFRQALQGMKQVQDSNMTHHDIKGANFLVGADGNIKVSDFGSAQVGDDKGEVATDFHFTEGYEAPEVKPGQKKITGKADTYSLGILLSKLGSPICGTDMQAPQWRSAWDFKSKQAATALDKLKNAMMDADPNKRPTLEAAMSASYMTDATANYPPKAISNLVKATMDYNKHVTGRIKEDQAQVLQYEGLIVDRQKKKQEKIKQGANPEDTKKLDAEIAQFSAEIKKLRVTIDQALAKPDAKPYVDALANANQAITGRGQKTPEPDLSTIKFKDAFANLAKSFGTKSDKLAQAMAAVDEADPRTKKGLAATAAQAVNKYADALLQSAKQARTEEVKLRASKLAVDLRKLQQVLQEAAK
jgi:serine/threonine protein kinase